MPFYLIDGKFLLDGGAFAISEDCCCAGTTNEQWKKCEDDTNAAVLTLAHSSVDYAWLCLSSVWVKCYNDALTASAATDPTVLEQCDNAAPTECADLIGWHASDDFGGTDCNSGTVGDTDWDVRFNIAPSQMSITAGSLDTNITSAAIQPQSQALAHSGDFEIYSTYTLNSGFNSGSINWCCIAVNTSKIYFLCRYANSTSDLIRFFDGTGFQDVTTTNQTGVLKITRVGSSVKAFIDGAQVGTAVTDSTNLLKSGFYVESGGAAMNVSFEDYVVVDGSSNPIYVDPSGQACT